jgi:hypothetical protein
MKFLNYLIEEYVTRVTWNPHRGNIPPYSAEIFIDPTRKELQEMKFVKYIVCAKNPKTFMLYVWDGESAIHHSTVMASLLNEGLWHSFVIMGWARYENGKVRNSTASSELSLDLKDIDLESLKKWIQKYFIIDSLPL